MSRRPLAPEEEQWTVVGRGRKLKKNGGRRGGDHSVKRALKPHQTLGNMQKLEHKIAEARAHQEVLSQAEKEDTVEAPLWKESCLIEVKTVLKAIQNCKSDLWNLGRDSFFRRAFESCFSLISNRSTKGIHEIVCYGVGNFSRPYSPSMVQLSAILVFREILIQSVEYEVCEKESDLWEQIQQHLNTHFIASEATKETSRSSSLEMSFFDPCTSSIEACILQDHLNIHMIRENTQGKRRVQRNQTTLFFMPHCPMRLYCNLLWANWDEEILCYNMCIIGNSLSGYDNTIMDSNRRSDETNGIFRIVPHVRDIPLTFPLKKALSSLKHSETAAGLQKAFNDCSFMSFQKHPGVHWPDRPLEFHNDGPVSEELLKPSDAFA